MIAIPLFFVGCALLFGEGPDKVKLTQGDRVLEGRVVFEGKDEIVLRVGGQDQRIPRADIASIQSLERSLSPIIDRDLRTADAAALQALAEQCQSAGLENEAKLFWLRVLLADPGNDAAVQALGAQRVLEEVKVRIGRDWYKLASLRKPQSGWQASYELSSTHFLLRTDLDLPFALDVTVALERFYRRFYETLGSPLELYVFDYAPEVDLYGNAKEFPVGQVRSDKIWFAPGTNTLNVLATDDPRIARVVYELSRQLLFNALRRSAGSTAQVPPWTASGIARTFALAAPEERGGPWSDLGKPDAPSFGIAQRANFDLDRIFNGTINDFNAAPQREELNACAYTLVQYLVFGADGKFRADYGRFLREGARGKISISALCEALKTTRKEIESGWHAYIDSNAK